jgi:hypothetical protein
MYIKNLQSIYHIEITNYNKSIYNLLETTFSSITKYQLVYTTILLVDYDVDLFENYYNTPNIFVNMLIGLKYTDIGGTFIMHFGSLAYKHIADIYVIISSFFEMNEAFKLGCFAIKAFMVIANKSSARTAANAPPKLPIGVRIPSIIKVSLKVFICCKNKEIITKYRDEILI